MPTVLSPAVRPRALGAGLLSAVVLLFAGCQDVTQVPDGPQPSPQVLAATASLQVVGHAVAVALADDGVRLAVRDALRDSPWDEHQVVFQEYVASPRGDALLTAAAAAAGETPAAFRARLAALPALDLFVPSREHRRAWRGTPDVVVAASVDAEGGPAFHYALGGRAARGGGAGALLLLAPSEGRVERADRQPVGVGDVIQSPEDGEVAQEVWWVTPDGKRTRITVAEAPRENGRGEVAADVVGEDTTFLDYVEIYFDDGAAGDVELNVDASFYGPDGALIGTAEYDNYSMPGNSHTSPHHPFFGHVVPDSGVAKVRIHVWEDDCDCLGNNDDDLGTRDFYWNDRGQVRTLADSDGDTDIELDWEPRAKSVFTSVLVGDVFVYEGDTSFTFAKAKDQYGYGLTGYSVSSWSITHTYIASIASSNGSSAMVEGESVGSTTISATISGITGYADVTVDEAPSCPPPQIICE